MGNSRICLIGLITSTACLICYLTWHNSYANKRILYLREFSANQSSTQPSTNQPSANQYSTQPSTSWSSTQPSTSQSSTQPSTSQSSTQSSTSTNPVEKKFVVCYSYWEQQTNSVLNLWSFQKWANLSGNFSVVEPFASNSVLGFTPYLANQHRFNASLRFRDYFDIERWTKGTAKYGIPPLVSWNTFFTQHTSKEVIVVLLAYDASPGGYYEGDKIKKNSRCKEESQTHMGNIHSLVNFLELKVVKTLCYAYYQKNNNKRLNEFNSLLELERNATILFSFWRGIEPGRITMDGEPLLQRQRETDILSMIFPSSKIEFSSRKYLKTILNANIQEYTAVVIRVVRRQYEMSVKGYSEAKVLQSFYKCFDQLPGMLKQLGLKVYLSADLGRFGDLTSRFAQRSDVFQQVINAVYNGSKTISSYEEEFVTAADGIVDRGYIAGMQKTIALNAKCIVMFGGFSTYQDSIIMHYRNTNQTCIKYLCYGKPFD